MMYAHRQLSHTTVDDRAWRKYCKQKLRTFKLLHKIGSVLRKRKAAALKAARGKTKDRIFYKVDGFRETLDIVQRSPAYGFFRWVGWPVSKLWLISQTAQDIQTAEEITRQWFAPRPQARKVG